MKMDEYLIKHVCVYELIALPLSLACDYIEHLKRKELESAQTIQMLRAELSKKQ